MAGPRPNPLDPSTLPAPHTWATYVQGRSEPFKTHSTLGLAKTALTQSFTFQRGGSNDAWVFRWDPDKDRWVEYAYLKGGDSKHPFWFEKNAKRAAKSLSEDELAKTLESIRQAGRTVRLVQEAAAEHLGEGQS